MPAADASQFTQFKKLQAAQSNAPDIASKATTRTTQSLPPVTGLSAFLPPPSGKPSNAVTFLRINVSLGLHTKPKVPGGNLFGAIIGTIPRISTLILDGGTPAQGGPVTFFGGTPSGSGAAIYDGGNP
jgi:hypothetical protein